MDLRAGRELLIEFYHLDLFDPAATGTEFGHMAVSIDGAVVWEEHVEIPSAASVYTERVLLNQSFRRGSELVLHLHNHGTNEWRVTGIELLPRCDQLGETPGLCTN